MKTFRKLLFASVACLLIWLGVFIYNRLTDGFNMHQITSSLPYYPEYEVLPLNDSEKKQIQNILEQPFYYIGKGCQFYVFESKDGKTVVKFLKHKHLRPFFWLKKIPVPQSLGLLFDEKIARRKARVENLFSSCKLAYEELKEESGLIYVHLNRTPALEKEITIVDKLGFKHTFPIDAHEFVLQKKALSVEKVFEGIKEDEVPIKVQNLIDLVKARCEKGIRDRDRSFVQNVAFSPDGKKAVFVDIGQFYKDFSISSEEEQIKDIRKRLLNLQDWLQRKFPSYVSHLSGFLD